MVVALLVLMVPRQLLAALVPTQILVAVVPVAVVAEQLSQRQRLARRAVPVALEVVAVVVAASVKILALAALADWVAKAT